MKFFTNQGVIQKTIIAIVIVILTTFCTPVPVQADWGGKLLSPIFLFFTAIADGFQHLLESALLGETSGFMKDIQSDDYIKATFVDLGSGAPEGSVLADSNGNVWTNIEIDGSFFGIDAVNVPVINYTPEAMFQNQVPALDINFITPSVKGDDERNTAVQLRSTIANWYIALRSIAVVGLLSVLIYLGIRMLLTSIAADRAKYKQMLMDWLVAMCLVMVLHYIMAFALTMTETVTAMITSEENATITVSASNVNKHWWNSGQLAFSTNLMGFVRFMVQSEEIGTKIAYFVLYVILVVYSYRFTWVYLKRVVNMAFLTLIAPMVALTYPIDKVSDGKAQAFNMWIKEYTYNALLQPIHLLLYKILLGSAIGLAAKNTIYAVVCLGFIVAAEKLVKQMFGFNKASGGTVGSLAGAAGVATVASRAMQGFGKKGLGAQGKIRTKDNPERQGKDANANKPFSAFKDKDANSVIGANDNTPAQSQSGNGGGEDERLPSPDGAGAPLEGNDNDIGQDSELSIDDQLAQEKAGMTTQDYRESGMSPQEWEDNRREELEEQRRQKAEEQARQEALDGRGYDNPFERPENAPKEYNVWDVMKQDTKAFGGRIGDKFKDLNDKRMALKTPEGRRKLKNKIGSELNKRAIGAWKAAPRVVGKAARGTAKAALLAGAGLTMGAIAIGGNTGDGEKTAAAVAGGLALGVSAGGSLLEGTIGKKIKNPNVRDAYEAGVYGNTIDARNARADKAYLKSDQFNEFYEKYYKGKQDEFGKNYSKEQIKQAVLSYRQAGITKESDIRRGLKLEEKYRKRDGIAGEDARKQVQNIAQSYGDMGISAKAFEGNKEARDSALNRIAGMLGDPKSENNKQMAKQIFQGYVDWRDSAV